MIFRGKAFESNADFDYPNDVIRKAKEKIKNFPTLNQIFENFSEVNERDYDKNSFVILARDAISNPFLGGNPDSSAEEKLRQFEIISKHVLPTLNKVSRERIKSRLKGVGQNHYKSILELELLIDLIKNDHVSSLYYEDPSKGDHDFSLILDKTELNLELTSIAEGRIQIILEDAFNRAAGIIINQIPEKTLIKLDVNTSLVLSEDNNNSSVISAKIVDQFAKISPIVNAVRNESCLLEKNLGEQEKSLYEINYSYKDMRAFGTRLSKLMESKEGIKFLKETKIKTLDESPFVSFSIGDAKARLVEIHSDSFWPSKSETDRKTSILRQLKTRIDEKIKGGQLTGKANPLILVNFQDIIFHNYSLSVDEFGEENFNELEAAIREIFNQNYEKEILGVIIYERSIKNSKFIWNPFVKPNDELLIKIKKLMTGN